MTLNAFFARMEQMLGPDYPAFVHALEQPRTHALRVNLLKLAPERLADLVDWQLEPVPWAPGGFYFPGDVRPGIHPFHAAGLYYIQEPSAMAPAAALAPRPGERVLDLCAAPGGKATQLGAFLQNQGLLVANEIVPKRAQILAENLERCGISCAVVTQEDPDRLVGIFSEFFDRIMVDAPCSGEGMFRKLEEAAEEWTPEAPAACARRQDKILAAAVRMLRPGGYLCYSTCTFAPEENEQMLLALLRQYPFLEVAEVQVPGASVAEPAWAGEMGAEEAAAVGRAFRFWPHRTRGEGHFLVLLRRTGAAEEVRTERAPARARGAKEPGGLKEAVQLYREFGARYLDRVAEGPFQLWGEALYEVPEALPDLAGVRVLRPGLHLGFVRKGRFEPAHALAMALPAGAFRLRQEVSLQDAGRYLRGETLPAEGPDGWTAVCLEGFSLGWGKAAAGILKNHYPKGLRWMQ